MNRQNNVPFKPAVIPRGAAPVYRQQQPASIAFSVNHVPRGFREAMQHISMMTADRSKTSDMAAKTPSAPKVQPAVKWRSSFKPIGDEDDNSEEQSTSSPHRPELSPYDPVSSESEQEMAPNQVQNRTPPEQDNKLGRPHLSPSRGCLNKGRWDIPYSERGSKPLNRHDIRHDISPDTRHTEIQGISPGDRLPEQRAYSPDTESLDPPGYSSISRPLDHRVSSPDRFIHSSSTQKFPASYGAQRTNGEERITIPEYKREMTTTGRLSPPRVQRDYQHQLGYHETGLDQIPPSTEVTRNSSKNIIMDKSPIVCDLCDVELSNGQELQHHLEGKTHWDTLEHIQQENNYDDLAIAFLQEAMLYKSRQCSRAIEDSVLQALQENDYMTKIEIFNCVACGVFLSTSASSVHTHITSREHLSNTKEFEVQQRRACLNKAETMMKELKPQFEHFLQGGSPFE
ncbi:uncharacterized protein [Pagrus major]|uniref:uncharacterized protein isoform X2 n=1 Tax=Pagrus major TaxID=143350 RepID=UPI003CC8D9BD